MDKKSIEVIFKDNINLSNKFNEFIINLLVDNINNKKVYEDDKNIKSGGNDKKDVK